MLNTSMTKIYREMNGKFNALLLEEIKQRGWPTTISYINEHISKHDKKDGAGSIRDEIYLHDREPFLRITATIAPNQTILVNATAID